jgi:hypothetical protein
VKGKERNERKNIYTESSTQFSIYFRYALLSYELDTNIAFFLSKSSFIYNDNSDFYPMTQNNLKIFPIVIMIAAIS